MGIMRDVVSSYSDYIQLGVCFNSLHVFRFIPINRLATSCVTLLSSEATPTNQLLHYRFSYLIFCNVLHRLLRQTSI